ncbi:MAG: alpha/beta hydrolase [Caldimonas sp.]
MTVATSNLTVLRHSVAGFEIQTRRLGQGPQLLFLHGAGGAGDLFPGAEPIPFLTQLAQHYEVHVPEHPGYGTQERPEWVDNIHDLAYFYLDYLAAAGLQGVHLVGQSLGGWVALEMAVRNTSALRSLSVVGSAGIHVKGVAKGDIFLWSRDEFAQRMFRNPEARAAFLARTIPPEHQKAFLRNRETTALLGWQPRLYDPHLHKWLHRIDVPTQVIWAENDEVLPPAYGEELARLIPNARLSVVADSGHLLYLDRPEALASHIREFIGETR